MADLVVRLYDLPRTDRAVITPGAFLVRSAMAYEKHLVIAWVRENFGDGWGSECDVAFANRPISCFLATQEGQLLGFACYDATCRGFFGPLGVEENARRQGVGRVLLIHCLRAMAAAGYGYAIVGGVDAPGFYEKTVGAFAIPGSTPGVYRDRLR